MTLDYASSLYVLFGLTLLLVTLSLLLLRGTRGGSESYSTPARFFLVALRLAIGWHFYVEGMEKLHTPTWSSEPYLREAVGPLAPQFHELAGDRLGDKLAGADGKQLPAALDAEWQAYFDAFVAHYGLDADQRAKAQAKLDAAKEKTAKWLASGTEEVVKIAPYPPDLKLSMTMKDRLAERARLQRRVDEAEARLPSGVPDLQKKYKDAKADLAKWRGGLKKSLEGQTAEMEKGLQTVLSPEQRSEIQPLAGPVRVPMRQWQLLDWSDAGVTWGLIVLGGALLPGLFSRLASAAGALLVLSFYLAMPPLPGWPESPRLEGHYLIINKTLIEVLALGALTFIPTGRWAGLDGLLPFLCPCGRSKAEVRRVQIGVPASEPHQPVG
jgi:uncharacterized membrane protein YphA (DoxX/SURF4 family)